MTENVTNELLLENLKAIQLKLVDHDHMFISIANEIKAMKSHLVGLAQSDLNRDADYATLAARLDRIEKRLELID